MESCMNCEYWIGKYEKCDHPEQYQSLAGDYMSPPEWHCGLYEPQQPACTIPPGKARPSYCGKMPDGADCAGCPWYGKEADDAEA